MKITAEALMDYLACPMRYKYRNVLKLDPLQWLNEHGNAGIDERGLEEVFSKQIHLIAYHLFHYVQDDKYPSEYLLRQKWGNAWAKGRTMEDLMRRKKKVKQAEENHTQFLENKGLVAISAFHGKFKEDPGIPLLIGNRVSVKAGRHEVDAIIDLVREKEGALELIEFNSGMNTRLKTALEIRPIKLHIRHDLSMTLAAMGFQQLTGERLDRMTYYDFITNREFETTRNDSDFKGLERTLDQVERAIDANIFYPVMNEQCLTCPFQKECETGSWYN